MKDKGMTLLLSLALVAGLFGVLPVSADPTAPTASTTIAISEFRTLGPNGGNDEFIEIFNLSPNAVNISGWKINGSNSSGSTSTRATVPANVSLASGCRYLFTNSATSGGPYSGSTVGDQTYSTGITNDGGIALLDSSNTIIDQVGMSTGSAYKEGTTLAPMSGNVNQSYERKPAGTNTTDTDNNANDFILNGNSSNPQNSQSGCTTLAITLADFYAAQQGDAVLVTWETVSELDNRGFNLYRGTSPAGWDRQLNTALIPSQSQGSPSGFVYTWEDRADLVPGTTYYYWLQDVDLSGATTLHGPVSVDFTVPTAVTLNGVSASAAAGAAALPWLWVAAAAGAALGAGRLRRRG